MLKCASLFTKEIDDPDLALSQIRAQLVKKIELMKNTVGVIMCHMEFVDSGVLTRIAEDMPFDVAGITTTAQAVNGAVGEMMLTVFVMTSDTIKFKAGMAESVAEEVEGPLRAAVDRAAGGASAAPSLVLAFPPLAAGKSGDEFTDAWDSILPGVPVFGTLSVNDYPDLSNGKAIFRGDALRAGHSFILCYGDVNPRFLIATLPEKSKMPHMGEVTKSQASVVSEIDGRSARDYLKRLGFTEKGFNPEGETSSAGFWFVPFLVSHRNRSDYDGVPVLRGLDSIAEDGSAVFSGKMDEGSTFTMLYMSADSAAVETKAKLGAIRDMPGVNGVLVFSCVVRHMMFMQKDNPLEELELAKETLPDAPFLMGYAGGEYCPTSAKGGVHVNRYHDYSLVALVL